MVFAFKEYCVKKIIKFAIPVAGVAVAALIVFLAAACDSDNGGGGEDSIPSALVGKWYGKASPNPLAFEITSARKFIMTGNSYDISVSGNTVTLKSGGSSVGTFAYAISNGEMVMTNGTGSGTAIVALSPVIKTVPQNPGGMTWAKVANSTFGDSAVNAVAWGNNVFVAVGAGGKIAHSADGKNWTAASNTTFTGAINCVAWGNGKFIAGGEGGRLASSPDGASWAAVASSGFNNNDINGIAWGADKWVAVGRNRMAYSNADGTSWTGMDSNTPFNFVQGSPNLRDVAYGGAGADKFVLVGAAGGQGHGASLAYSANGINWTARDMEDLAGDAITGVCFGNGAVGGSKFVANTLSSILYSTNGTDWNDVEGLSYSIFLYDVAAGGAVGGGASGGSGKFAAVGANDRILFSDDGISWAALTGVSLNSSNFLAVAYGGDTWVVAGMNGVIAYSEGN